MWNNVAGCMIGYGVYVTVVCLVKRMLRKQVVDLG